MGTLIKMSLLSQLDVLLALCLVALVYTSLVSLPEISLAKIRESHTLGTTAILVTG